MAPYPRAEGADSADGWRFLNTLLILSQLDALVVTIEVKCLAR
jgi:hypothetical protein